jgi:CheY-like chemotaxis protein
LEAVAALGPDVLVSDIGMPLVDGYELARRVRALPDARLARTPAIAVTAYARGDDARQAREAGFQAHLAKPIDPEQLVATVAKVK